MMYFKFKFVLLEYVYRLALFSNFFTFKKYINQNTDYWLVNQSIISDINSYAKSVGDSVVQFFLFVRCRPEPDSAPEGAIQATRQHHQPDDDGRAERGGAAQFWRHPGRSTTRVFHWSAYSQLRKSRRSIETHEKWRAYSRGMTIFWFIRVLKFTS